MSTPLHTWTCKTNLDKKHTECSQEIWCNFSDITEEAKATFSNLEMFKIYIGKGKGLGFKAGGGLPITSASHRCARLWNPRALIIWSWLSMQAC